MVSSRLGNYLIALYYGTKMLNVKCGLVVWVDDDRAIESEGIFGLPLDGHLAENFAQQAGKTSQYWLFE